LFGLGKGPFVSDVDRDEESEIVLLWFSIRMDVQREEGELC
jgi:hypothetical protein